MTPDTIEATAELVDALLAENDALRAMDIPRAAAHFPRKAEWSRRLQLSLAAQASGRPLDDERVRRLQDLALENRRLLERAMFVQGRLIATLARAAPPPRVGYGRLAPLSATPPMALSARV